MNLMPIRDLTRESVMDLICAPLNHLILNEVCDSVNHTVWDSANSLPLDSTWNSVWDSLTTKVS